MDGLKDILKGLRLRDLTLVVLCGLIVYLFRAQDSYQLIPMWRKMAKSEHFANKAYPTSNEKLPSAVITDLESDGINEIVLITNDLRLSIMAMPDGNRSGSEGKKWDARVLPNVIIKAAVDLPANDSLPGGREWPVVMETGYLIPYKSLVQVRKQVIVVILDSWTVLCYNHDLQLLWKRQLMDTSSVRQTHIVKAMSALVSPISVQKDDQGLVVVSGSLVHASHSGRHRARHSHSTQAADNDYFSHFSTFALSGQDGTTRWQHLPGDFDKLKTKDEEEVFHWKLGLTRGHLHVGESPWGHFQSDVLQQLPHYWNDLKNTGMTLANMKKNLIGQPSQQPAVTDAMIGALGGDHIMGYAYGGMRPHSHHEHVENANVIVIHNQNGVEVLSLQTGRPVTKLSLPEGQSAYVDIDGDTIIEKVSFYLEDEFSKERICNVEVQHYMWRLKKKKFQTNVCDSWRFFWGWTVPEREDTVKHLPPRVIKSVAEKRSIFQHLLGDHLVSAGKAWDIIVTTSSGRVTSLSSSGAIQWQLDTPASWVNEAESAAGSTSTDHSHQFYSSFQPSIIEFSIQVYGKKDTLAMLGWRTLAIVDLKKGRLLGEHSLPCQPTDTPVIGDFDNDGNNDIVLVCRVGYIGFSIHKQPNHVYTAVYGAGVFLGVLLITWCLMSDSDQAFDSVD